MNAIRAIHPFRREGLWVFDQEALQVPVRHTSEDWGVVFLVSARDTRAAHEHIHPCNIPRPVEVPGSRTEKRGLK